MHLVRHPQLSDWFSGQVYDQLSIATHIVDDQLYVMICINTILDGNSKTFKNCCGKFADREGSPFPTIFLIIRVEDGERWKRFLQPSLIQPLLVVTGQKVFDGPDAKPKMTGETPEVRSEND